MMTFTMYAGPISPFHVDRPFEADGVSLSSAAEEACGGL